MQEAKVCRVETPSETARDGGVFAISPNGAYVVDFRRGGGEIDVWDARAGERLRTVPVGDAPIERWAFSQDGRRIKIAGRSREETTIDLAAGVIAPSDASPFQPWRSSGEGRTFDAVATIEDGAVTAPVGVGAYVQQHYPWVGKLEYNECCNWSSVLLSFSLSDDGDYALAYLGREHGDLAPNYWPELKLYRVKDHVLVARVVVPWRLGPITRFAADGRVAVIGDLWGGVTMAPLAERGHVADGIGRPGESVTPTWAVLAPMKAEPGALVAAYMRYADKAPSAGYDDLVHDGA